MIQSDPLYPLTLFRYQVEFEQVSLSDGKTAGEVAVCNGAFSECSGLEATMSLR